MEKKLAVGGPRCFQRRIGVVQHRRIGAVEWWRVGGMGDGEKE
jgi:hypothetical protein